MPGETPPPTPSLTDSPTPETDTQKLYDKYTHVPCGFVRRHAKWLILLLLPLVLFGCAAVYFYIAQEYEDYAYPIRAQEARETIGSIRLTLRDADGSNLPPEPDPAVVNTTTAGVDANANMIRDDVELALFDLYPITEELLDDGTIVDTQLHVRAAALQYAQAMQVMLTRVDSEEKMREGLNMIEYAERCIGEEWEAEKSKLDNFLVLNTQERKEAQNKMYEQYLTSYVTPQKVNPCHI